MQILLNGESRDCAAALIDELGLASARVATALDGDFVAARARGSATLRPGSSVEIVGPMQGG
jgi:sulfur carrier protein